MGWWVANTIFQLLCLVSWYVNRKNLPPQSLFIAAMVLITFIIETMATYYGYILDYENNLFFFHFLTPLQYTFLSLPYYQLLPRPYLKLAILFSILSIFILAFLLGTFVQTLQVYNTHIQLASFFFLALWSSLYLWYFIASNYSSFLIKDAMALISISLIFYASTNFVATGMLNYLILYKNKWAMVLYDFTTIIAFAFYCLLAFSFSSQKLFNKYSITEN